MGMSYRRNERSSLSIFALIVLLGVIGGIAGGAYFFIFPKEDETVADIPDVPPSVQQTQAAAQSSGASANPTDTTDDPAGENVEFPRLLIPAAGVDQIIVTSYIVDGEWEIRHIRNRIGHLEGTAWLNQNGNVVLAAHVELSDGTPGAFARIDEMGVGDDLFISENGVEYHYEVTEIKSVEPDDLSVVYNPADGHEIVTLITCSDYDFISDTYEKRTIIIARKVEES